MASRYGEKKKREKVTDFIFLASKTLQTVTVVMKLKKKKKKLAPWKALTNLDSVIK